MIRMPGVPPYRARHCLVRARIRIAQVVAVIALALVWMCCVPSSATATPVPAVAPHSAPEPSEITKKQLDAAKKFAGPDGTVARSNVMVKHADNEYGWIVLCAGRKADGSVALTDSDGGVYEGGIDDFRANNGLLGEDDEITYNRHIAAADPPKNVDMVTKSGHTSPDRTLWYVGGGAATVVILAACGLLVRRGRRRTSADDSEDEWAALWLDDGSGGDTRASGTS